MKIMCVVGARPNFMKAAPVMEELRKQSGVNVVLVHTGQHYDRKMSELFFEELAMPRPDVELHVGSGSHGEQTGQILIRLEPILQQERPDLLMVFGDVNSTISAALCAAKLNIKVAHVEAGLRSYDRTMPEELNRLLTDHLADFLFTTEPGARKNLLREGISEEKIFFVGNVMVDTLLKHRERAQSLNFMHTLGLRRRKYGILTLHRPAAVDHAATLAAILESIAEVAKEIPIVFPCHPRTRQQLDHPQVKRHLDPTRLLITEPLGYLEFLSLMSDASLVLTDSGGIQEETTILGVPCLTLRQNTERPVTIEQGTNTLVGHSRDRILAAAAKALDGKNIASKAPKLWDGHAGERVAAVVMEKLAERPGSSMHRDFNSEAN